MKAPGGKDGARRRIYHPRFGRWMVQHSLEVAFSFNAVRYSAVLQGCYTHHNILDDLVICKEAFLSLLVRVQPSGGTESLTLYHSTFSEVSSRTYIFRSSITSELWLHASFLVQT